MHHALNPHAPHQQAAAAAEAVRPPGGNTRGGGWRLLLLLLLAALLAGCATRPPVPEAPSGELLEARVNALLAKPVWRTVGRVSITTPEDSATLSLDWRQINQDWVLNMRGPIGTGSLRMQGGPDGARFMSSDGTSDQADDARELLYRHTGFDLPVEVLQDWLRGIPATTFDAELELDDFGRVLELEQLGWQVVYSRWRSVEGVEMPMRMSMQGPGVEVRAALRSWDFSGD